MANGKLLLGQLLYGIRRLAIPFTKQMMDKASADALVGDANTEITPNDQDSSEVRVFDAAGAEAAFEAEWIEFAGTMDIPLPNRLSGCNVTYEKGGEAGEYNDAVTAWGITAYHSIGLSVNGSAQASAFCIPKLVYDIIETYSQNLPVKHCFFYDADPTIANVLIRLSAELGAAVAEWPTFQPEAHTIVCIGQRVQSSAKGAAQVSDASSSGGSSFSESIGAGSSYEYAPSIQIERLPPTLHGTFSLDASDTITKTAEAMIDLGTGGSSTGTIPAAAVAEGSVSPADFFATTPAGFPSGLHLYKLLIEPNDEFGYFFVHAVVFDFDTVS
jgi:hypothetical protein